MNKRIRELINLSTERVELNIRGDDTIDTEMVFNKEKFAELIVRECMEVCKSRVGNSDYNTGRMHCASDLKDHFGVEE